MAARQPRSAPINMQTYSIFMHASPIAKGPVAGVREVGYAANMPHSATKEVTLLGSSGYAGQAAHALLTHHPDLHAWTPSARAAGDLRPVEADRILKSEAVLLALPADPSRRWVGRLRELGVRRILDLSDAFRRDPEAHYGIPERFGAPPEGTTLVANPGCYPTASLLALHPLVSGGLVEPEGIAIVGASGASGAGKGLREDLHFSHLHDNLFPYNVGRHRHVPEIEHHLGAPVSFVTELLPIVRGLMVTAFVRPKVPAAELRTAMKAAYEAHPYVTVVDEPDARIGLRHVVGTHQALVAVGPEERSGLVPVFCAIDNLMRGAATQALHNLNLWLGLPFDAGLPPALPPTGTVPGFFATAIRPPSSETPS